MWAAQDPELCHFPAERASPPLSSSLCEPGFPPKNTSSQKRVAAARYKGMQGCGACLELGRKTASWKMSEGMLKPSVSASSNCSSENTATLDSFSPCTRRNTFLYFHEHTKCCAACELFICPPWEAQQNSGWCCIVMSLQAVSKHHVFHSPQPGQPVDHT